MALHSIVQVLMLVGPVMAEWQKLNFSSTFALQVSDIISVLKETAQHPEGAMRRPDNRWGYGLIQPAEALKVLD